MNPVASELALLVSELNRDRCFPDTTEHGFAVTHLGTTWDVGTLDESPGQFNVTRHGEFVGVWGRDRVRQTICS
jgi:hypothetical protein